VRSEQWAVPDNDGIDTNFALVTLVRTTYPDLLSKEAEVKKF